MSALVALVGTPPDTPFPPIELACGAVLPGTAHTLDCGTGGEGRPPPRRVPAGAVVFVPPRPAVASVVFLLGRLRSPVTVVAGILGPLLAGAGAAAATLRVVVPVVPAAAVTRQLPSLPPFAMHQWFEVFPPPAALAAAGAAAAPGLAAVAAAAATDGGVLASAAAAAAAAASQATPMAIDTLDAARSTRRVEALLAAEARAVPPSGAVALVGQSLGGAMALHLAARGRLPSVRAVVALSPFLPLAETYPAALRADGGRPNMTVVHAVDDALVPLALGVGGARVLADAYAGGGGRGGVAFVALPEGGHEGYLRSPVAQGLIVAAMVAGVSR
ncbi:hypothetical protein BU14_0025s0065 [Porphyra umbilicalis]|uniref:Phospholipase/carboxylesterase/thioesterase domain-containing protein n=1 Tax=Porphyra umbilicalis TaxID=2786 RepID=A0A1X6PJV3_PORUM|nr:hypothetical protein BU14_0025s0065 [Porphyra umbilicalis]|eukprot:OSX81184.1 hypothetical protein BU14_0025s0065 [Porphyra umbilicalis]